MNNSHNLVIGEPVEDFDFEYILKIGSVVPGHTPEFGAFLTVAASIVEELSILEGVIDELASTNKIFPEDFLWPTFAGLYRNGN